jgi:hypothetical protein
MYNKVKLSTTPDLNQVIQRAFPSYRKLNCFVTTFPEAGVNINSYWDGGSRREYALVELSTMQRKSLPTNSLPYFDKASRGMANLENPAVSTDHVGNITLKYLPVNFVLVEAGTFCGKSATAFVYVNPENMPKLLEGGK